MIAGPALRDVKLHREPAGALLQRHRILDAWFPARYSLDLYKGCPAACLYCPATFMPQLRPVFHYENVLPKLAAELAALQIAQSQTNANHPHAELIGLGAGFHDPFSPSLQALAPQLLMRVLAALHEHGHRALSVTKYPTTLVELMDAHVGHAAFTAGAGLPLVVSAFTLMEAAEATVLEPKLPAVQERLTALQELHQRGVPLGALILSLAPWDIAAETERLLELVQQLKTVGVNFIMLTFPFAETRTQLYQQLTAAQPAVPSLKRFAAAAKQFYAKPGTLSAAAQGTLALEQTFREKLRNLTLFFMPPPPFYRNWLSVKDLATVTLIQLYYLLLAMGKRRAFFRLAAYQLSIMTETNFQMMLREQTLHLVPGIGTYTEQLILKMTLKNDFTTFDQMLLQWYQL